MSQTKTKFEEWKNSNSNWELHIDCVDCVKVNQNLSKQLSLSKAKLTKARRNLIRT